MQLKNYTPKILAIIILLLGVFSSKFVVAQGQFTNMGKDFLFGFPNNYNNPYIGGYEAGLHLELKIVTSKATHVKITYYFDNTEDEFDIAANQVHSYVFTDSQRNKIYSNIDGTDLRTFRVETDQNVTIYAISLIRYTTDATAVLPINNWGREYIHLGAAGSGYAIMAKEDGTSVTIAGGTPIVLNKNQIYRNSLSGSGALGKKIVATKDIAVLTTHQCTTYPNGACDHQLEQLIPIANFGKEFLVPKAGMSSEAISVVAVENSTNVTMYSGTSTPVNHTLNAGQQYQYVLSADTYIVADKQIEVLAHIGGTSQLDASCGGDPGTALVPPIEQHINRAYIAPFVTSKSAITCHYILLMVKTENKGLTKINGATVTSGWREHVASGYSVLVYKMSSLIPYEIENDKGVVVLAYGVGHTESYYYLAASSARKLDASFYITNDGERYHYQDANLSVPFDCGSPFTFEAEIQYNLQTSPGHIKWYVDGVEETSAQDRLTWTQPYLSGGNHTVKLAITDEHGEVEELETTLNVECATDMSPKTAAIYEGDTQEMTITLSGIAPTNIVFNLSVYTGTTAQASDYSFPATATIAAGSDEVKLNVIAQLDNIINEPDELLVLRAYNSEYGELFSNITIKDKSTTAQKTLTLSANPIEINEPHTGYTTTPNGSVLTLSLPSSITTDTIIRVGLAYAGTAIIDTDYTLSTTAAKTYIEIPQGGSSASFTLTAKEDNLYEGAETVVITPTAPAGHTMSTASVTVTINDKTPSAIVVATILDAEESATASVSGKFRIRFSKTEVTTKKPITVVYKLTGTANDGTAYDLINPTQAIIPLDQSYVDVEVKPKNNFVVEGARKVNIELLSVTD